MELESLADNLARTALELVMMGTIHGAGMVAGFQKCVLSTPFGVHFCLKFYSRMTTLVDHFEILL